MKKASIQILIIFFFFCGNIFAQTEPEFKTVKDYLEYSEKMFTLPKEELFYISSDANVTYPSKRSLVYFIKGDKLATIEEVALAMNTKCSPNKMMERVTLEAIEKSLTADDFGKTFSAKNMLTDEVYKRNDDELVVVFLYNYSSGNFGQLYIKEREEIKKNLGLPILVVTVDNSSIAELANK